jgi:hypothetical protein
MDLTFKSIGITTMQKITRVSTLSVFLIGFLSGCVSNPSTYIDPAIQAQAPQLIIANKPVGDGYYALLEKIDGHWKVISIQDNPVYSRDNDDQEILFVNHRLRSIAPSFDPRMYVGEGANCTPMAQLRTRNRYWLCKSYFSSIRIGMTVGGNIVSCALTFCLAAGTKEELDRDKIQAVVIDSDLINAVKTKIANKNANNDAFKVFEASIINTKAEIREMQRENLRKLNELESEIAKKAKEN